MAFPGVGPTNVFTFIVIQLPLICISGTALFMLSSWRHFLTLIVSVVLGCAVGAGWYFLWLGPLQSPISLLMLLGTVWLAYLPVLLAFISTRPR